MATRRLLPYFLTKVKTQSEIDRLHSIFRMSPTKIYVGGIGLTPECDDALLERTFSEFGDIKDAQVVIDRSTGSSRGFGFVTFTNLTSATTAVAAMDRLYFQGRALRVKLSNGI